MIFYDEQTKIFYLESKGLTYAFSVSEGIPEHLWFGARIARDNLHFTRGWGANGFDAELPGQFCRNHLAAEVPTYARGDYREPMLSCRGEAGEPVCELRYVRHHISDSHAVTGMPSTYGGQTLELTVEDPVKGMEATLFYTVFEDAPSVTRFARISNTGKGMLKLERAYSFSFDLPGNQYDVLSLFGAWARERMPERTPVRHGVTSIDSKRGSSSAVLNPFLGILARGTSETSGDAYGVSLVYSSSFRLLAEGTQSGRTRVCGGINDFGFSEQLAPGEGFDTPEVVLAYSGEGIGGMSRALHDTFRSHLIPPAAVASPRPIVINNWEATFFAFDYEKLFAIIDSSAGRGIDTFVLDDGWFGTRDNDRSGLGDWFINRTKLPQGLTPIIDRCHERGLKFGLWFEPEMVNPDSDLYRAHPDWAVHVPGYEPMLCRHQLMLDLTRGEVRDYVVNAVTAILDTNEIDYVKWDSNRNLTEMYSESLPAGSQGAFAHRWVLGLYDICRRIISSHPSVFFEGCSGGGARFDPAMLAFFPQIWTSDDTDAGMRTRIQYGTSIVYPLSAMSCHVSACPNHQVGRMSTFETRAAVAHLGATGYELNTSHLPQEELDKIPAQTAEYRRMEPLVQSGDLYRLSDPFTSSDFAFLLVAKDRSLAHLTLIRQMTEANEEGFFLRMQGLDPDAVYFIEETGERLHGSTLMQVGIRIRGMRDFGIFIRHFTRQ